MQTICRFWTLDYILTCAEMWSPKYGQSSPHAKGYTFHLTEGLPGIKGRLQNSPHLSGKDVDQKSIPEISCENIVFGFFCWKGVIYNNELVAIFRRRLKQNPYLIDKPSAYLRKENYMFLKSSSHSLLPKKILSCWLRPQFTKKKNCTILQQACNGSHFSALNPGLQKLLCSFVVKLQLTREKWKRNYDKT